MKKTFSALLALSILCGMSAQVFAESAPDNMHAVLNSVKSRITISSGYDAFLSDSYTDGNGTEYEFSWESEEKSINITANENGIISSYHTNDDVSENKSLPAEEMPQNTLYESACRYVRQLNPDIYDNLKITADTNGEYTSDDSYYFEIQRYENNIPVDGNGGYIEISSDGKTIKDFSLTYTPEIEFEKPDSIISRKDAQKAYADKIGFSLCYGSKFDDNGIAAVPMYTAIGEHTKYISAANGNLIKLNDITYSHDDPAEVKSGAVPYPEARYEYTENTANELKGMTGILSEKQAEKIVRKNKTINIPKKYTLKTICGTKDIDGSDKCFYTLLFTGTQKSDFVEVMIDAKSGEIVNFRRTQNNGDHTITNEKAKKIAQNAVLRLAPKHVNDYILDESTNDGVFTFIRTVNGIEFAANQIEVCVDMTNGNIVWYDYSFSDINFPPLEKVIPKDKTAEIFFENLHFNPAYVLNCSKPGMTKYDRATLVYKFSNSDITDFDAFTGKPMWD